MTIHLAHQQNDEISKAYSHPNTVEQRLNFVPLFGVQKHRPPNFFKLNERAKNCSCGDKIEPLSRIRRLIVFSNFPSDCGFTDE